MDRNLARAIAEFLFYIPRASFHYFGRPGARNNAKRVLDEILDKGKITLVTNDSGSVMTISRMGFETQTVCRNWMEIDGPFWFSCDLRTPPVLKYQVIVENKHFGGQRRWFRDTKSRYIRATEQILFAYGLGFKGLADIMNGLRLEARKHATEAEGRS